MRGSELLIKALENEGVEYIFGLPGEQTTSIMDELSRSDIDLVLTRHEQGAAFMADVYGRLTGDAGVCLSTLGPGATNLITAVADANLDAGALVALTGQLERDKTHKESHQYIDVVNILSEVTQFNKSVEKPEAIPEIVRKSFQIAESEKPGATHIELPADVLENKDIGEPLLPKPGLDSDTKPDAETVREVAELIEDSENPYIIAGNGVIRSGASEELTQFVKQNNIPVVTTFMGKGAISAREDLSIGTIGLQNRDYVMCGIEKADLIIAVGTDYIEYYPEKWNPDRDKEIIHIDSRIPEVDKHYRPSAQMVGNIRQSLRTLKEEDIEGKDAEYSRDLKRFIEDEFNKYTNDDSLPMKPQRIVHDLREHLADDDVLITDTGAHKLWMSRLYPTYEPNTFIVSNGLATMGIALPGAIGAKLAEPERNIVATIGDGCFVMNAQELETATRLNLDLTLLVFNDQELGAITWKQVDEYGHKFGAEFDNPDFVKLAESYGAQGHRVESPCQLTEILEKSLDSGEVDVIEVPVDPEENHRLTEKLGEMICPT